MSDFPAGLARQGWRTGSAAVATRECHIGDRLVSAAVPNLRRGHQRRARVGSRSGGEFLTGKRIQVVEDEALLAGDLNCELVCGTAVSPAAALQVIERHPVDAAIIDINLGSGPAAKPLSGLRISRFR